MKFSNYALENLAIIHTYFYDTYFLILNLNEKKTSAVDLQSQSTMQNGGDSEGEGGCIC